MAEPSFTALKLALVDKFVDLGFFDTDLRRMAITELESELGADLAIARSTVPRHDLLAIVNGALAHPGGLSALGEIVHLLVGDRANMNELHELIQVIETRMRQSGQPESRSDSDASDRVAGSTTGGRPESVAPASGPSQSTGVSSAVIPDTAPSTMATGPLATDAEPSVSSDPSVTAEDATAVDLDADADGSAGIVGRGYGDRPTYDDLLHRTALVIAVTEMLAPGLVLPGEAPIGPATAATPPPPTSADSAGPMVVAIEGPWGSGKTTMLNLIEQRLGRLVLPDGRDEPPPAPGTPHRLRAWQASLALSGWLSPERIWRPAWRRAAGTEGVPHILTMRFVPWNYQTGEQIWAGLVDLFLAAARPIVEWDGNARERYWFRRNMDRLDAHELQRSLRRRLVSPLLAVGVLALVAPVVAQLARATDTTYTLADWRIAGVNVAVLVPAVLLGAGVLHTAYRYLMRPAASVLPAELFCRPILSGVLAGTGADPAIRDPYYRARVGYLYLAQHDVFEVLQEVDAAGCQLVVLVDDLDRCTSRTSTEVFEAINMFLTENLPTARFVIGLDANAVVAHLDASYPVLAATDTVRHLSDPSAGWSFLRKLIQLYVTVPPLRPAQVPDVTAELLGGHVRTPATGGPDAVVSAPGPTTVPDPDGDDDREQRGRSAPDVTTIVRTLELDAGIRRLLDERIAKLPTLSVREVKRLLTTWQFSIRVAERLQPLHGRAAVRRASTLIILAEIATRWPAAQRSLHRRVEGQYALDVLACAVATDQAWTLALQRVGLDGHEHTNLQRGLRALLRRYQSLDVARLAEQLH